MWILFECYLDAFCLWKNLIEFYLDAFVCFYCLELSGWMLLRYFCLCFKCLKFIHKKIKLTVLITSISILLMLRTRFILEYLKAILSNVLCFQPCQVCWTLIRFPKVFVAAQRSSRPNMTNFGDFWDWWWIQQKLGNAK